MARFCEGDAPAFESLFERHAKPIHAFLARLTGSSATADDLTQATFLSVVRARGRFRRGARFRPWLYAIATNAARDLRRRHREELTPEGQLPASLVADGEGPRDVGLERQVRAALAQLPDAQREAIVLHRFEGLSFTEIAEALDLSESAVKVRAHRGYEKLRELLRGAWEEAK